MGPAALEQDEERRGRKLFRMLTSLFRTYAIPEHSVVVPGPFRCDDRNCFNFVVPDDWPSDEGQGSTVRLLEDGEYLGPPGISHDDIRTLGQGRYSHWGPKMYFSTSDNSDPNSNGRIYSVVPPQGWTPPPGSSCWAEYKSVRQREAGEPLHVEWAQQDVAPASIEHVQGNVFAIALRDGWASDDESLSTLLLLEDDEPLSAAHLDLEQLEARGQDGYGHHGRRLLFCSRDGSDPRTHGHGYTLAHAPAFVLGHARRPPRREQGHCWILDDLPSEWNDGDGPSHLRLLEDGKLLGPSDALHADIREEGGGHFCHWNGELWFSTSDGSDPATNGRTYTVVWVEDESAIS